MWNAWLDEAQSRIKIAGRNINNLTYADDTTLVAENEEESRNFLMNMKKEWKNWLKTQHPKNEDQGIWPLHFMVNKWRNEGNSDRLNFFGLQNHCGMVTATMKKSYDKPRQHVKKQRHYFANKAPYSQSYGFSSSHVWMWELDHKESWLPKSWCFELWCWQRLLQVPWTARRSNQSILKEISLVYSLEGLMLKLKLQYFCHLMQRADSLEKTLMLRKIEGRRIIGCHHWLDGHEFDQALGIGDRQGSLACSTMGSQRVRHNWETELNWNTYLI